MLSALGVGMLAAEQHCAFCTLTIVGIPLSNGEMGCGIAHGDGCPNDPTATAAAPYEPLIESLVTQEQAQAH